VVNGDRVPIRRIDSRAYQIPTDAPESDGTYAWHSTTLVIVRAAAGDHTGLGYTYADSATCTLIRDLLADVVAGRDALAIPEAWAAMVCAVRNLGRPGIASMAIAAVDAALWDLKGRILGLPVVTLLGAARLDVPIYGSGGFTSYDIGQLREQLGSWVAAGIAKVKMKIGRDPSCDPDRVKAARDAIGPNVQLFVDANGAFARKSGLAMAKLLVKESDISWFEEPVSSDDLEGLRFIRERAPAELEIAAGEYGYDITYFSRMLEARAVDVLQADASRCGGISGFLKVTALCEAFGAPLSAHCAPTLHVHAACASAVVRHLEYFHDHARIERTFFDGAPSPREGKLRPDLTRPGLGIDFKDRDAKAFAI
jgi:L-alanine-DL-glutamate epimerase-like enolase superfamily enzyme